MQYQQLQCHTQPDPGQSSNSAPPLPYPHRELIFNGIISFNRQKLFRNIIGIIIIIVTSYQVRSITMEVLQDSRQLNRALNYNILQHDDFDIYWFGFNDGQYLLNYPIQQYYVLDDVVDALGRMQEMMGNLDEYMFGFVNQTQLNTTEQYIFVQGSSGIIEQYEWRIQDGIEQPFDQDDPISIKDCLSRVLSVHITVRHIEVEQKVWNIVFKLEPFANGSIFLTIIFNEELNLNYFHIPTLLLGIILLFMIINNLKSQKYRIQAHDFPDILLCFFLFYSSIANMSGTLTFHYGILLDGVTCFISWLWALKFFTHEDDYHISFLIKKSYILVGRLFVSFGPLFIAFCLFAVTVFCRYADLFDNIHKGFISIFCVCYYNMTYEQFRATERLNPLSAIFFTSLVLMFTACIYSGLLVSVFCSYIWNKREQKTKQQLLQMLKIQCAICHNKYSYSEGSKKFEEEEQNERNARLSIRYSSKCKEIFDIYLEHIQRIFEQSQQICENERKKNRNRQIPEIDAYLKQCRIKLKDLKFVLKEL